MSGSAFASMLDSPAVHALFGPQPVVQAMLEVESALAAAQAEVGLISAEQARVVQACCGLEGFDVNALLRASSTAGSLAIPLVKALTQRVQRMSPEAAGSVHWGATSQDIIDTAWCLQAHRAMALLDAELARSLDALLVLRARHGHAPLLARTLMQPASLITFSARLLNWFAPLVRARERLRHARERALRLQLGGAVGTAAAWAEQAQPLSQALARRLGLPADVTPWQVQRDELARLCAELGVLCGSLGKVAVDVSLMSQAEVGEFQESTGAGRGGSSAMPHKRNPVGSLIVRSALHRAAPRVSAVIGAMAHEHERALGAWQAELAEAADLMALTCGAAQALATALEGAQADEQAMLRNIERLNGLPMAEALARRWSAGLGREEAQARVQQLCVQVAAQGRHLRELALEAEQATVSEALHMLFDPVLAAAAGASNTEAAWKGILEIHEGLR